MVGAGNRGEQPTPCNAIDRMVEASPTIACGTAGTVGLRSDGIEAQPVPAPEVHSPFRLSPASPVRYHPAMPTASTPSLPTLLVVDDEPKIRAAVHEAVARDIGRFLEARTGASALDITRRERPDLVVLDLGLPDMEGVEVCRGIREFSHVPILVLSARHSEDEKERLLDAGADDYVTKPFGTVEFRARLRAHVRRSRLPTAVHGAVELGPFHIDLERRTASRDGAAVHLTPTEWSLLQVLVANAGRTMTHRQLFGAVWGASRGDAQQYLRVYMGHLRRKLEPDPYRPRHFVTEPGVGYRFEAEVASDAAH